MGTALISLIDFEKRDSVMDLLCFQHREQGEQGGRENQLPLDKLSMNGAPGIKSSTQLNRPFVPLHRTKDLEGSGIQS